MDLQSRSVALAQCGSYDTRGLVETIDRLWSACGAPVHLRSTEILIKPNLIGARAGPLACTNGDFIAAAAGLFVDRGCRVTVGDSPAFGTARSVLRKIGCLDELLHRGVRISDFKKVREITLPSGTKAGMAADALDCDLLINLPKVKAHAQFRVSLAVKNFFGCLAGMRKPLWHMVHGGKEGKFASLLVEFLSVLPNGITLVDGITAMNRTGPMGGEPFALGVAACTSNPVAADRAMLDIIGVRPEASPILLACAGAGLNGCRLEDLDFPLQPPRELRVQGFLTPLKLSPVRFSLLRFLQGSCRRMLQRTGGPY